jgi:mRNA interferase MazF
MQKNFDVWNEEKKVKDNLIIKDDFFYHSRELWWCSVGVNIGVEADGKNENFERPILIIRKFNKDMFWGVPLTSKEKFGEFYHKLLYDSGTAWINLSQLKIFSSKRLIRKIREIPEEEFEIIKNKLRSFI